MAKIFKQDDAGHLVEVCNPVTNQENSYYNVKYPVVLINTLLNDNEAAIGRWPTHGMFVK